MNRDIEDYIESHISSEPEELNRIDRQTNLRYINGRMCSGHIQGRLLKMLVRMIRPKRILEIGTFTGYSALCMGEAISSESRIDTIEIDDELEEQILDNFAQSVHGDKITLHIGNALEIMKKMDSGEYDLVVIDADKREYQRYFEEAIRLIRKEGFIIADNTLWDGHVTESGRHSSQTRGIIEFNDMVARYPGIEVAMIPMRDGLTIIRKN